MTVRRRQCGRLDKRAHKNSLTRHLLVAQGAHKNSLTYKLFLINSDSFALQLNLMRIQPWSGVSTRLHLGVHLGVHLGANYPLKKLFAVLHE